MTLIYLIGAYVAFNIFIAGRVSEQVKRDPIGGKILMVIFYLLFSAPVLIISFVWGLIVALVKRSIFRFLWDFFLTKKYKNLSDAKLMLHSHNSIYYWRFRKTRRNFIYRFKVWMINLRHSYSYGREYDITKAITIRNKIVQYVPKSKVRL